MRAAHSSVPLLLFEEINMKPILLFSLVAASVFAQAGKPTLKVGDTAPEFVKLPSSVPGKTFSLADFKGKKTVVLAFFPLAFTGG